MSFEALSAAEADLKAATTAMKAGFWVAAAAEAVAVHGPVFAVPLGSPEAADATADEPPAAVEALAPSLVPSLAPDESFFSAARIFDKGE